MEKVCIKCRVSKDISLFVKTKNSCKDCEKEYKKNYRKLNSEYLRDKDKEYYNENKERICNKQKENYSKNKDKKLEYQREYYINNKELISEYKRKHAKENKDSIREYKSNYQNKRRKEDPIFMLKHSISRTIRNSLKVKGFSKSKKSIEILGCEIDFFKSYLEERFTEEMTWQNYGLVWDIDHIIPLSTAITEEDVIKLNHYTNLQPLNSYINRNIKKDKLNFYDNFTI